MECSFEGRREKIALLVGKLQYGAGGDELLENQRICGFRPRHIGPGFYQFSFRA